MKRTSWILLTFKATSLRQRTKNKHSPFSLSGAALSTYSLIIFDPLPAPAIVRPHSGNQSQELSIWSIIEQMWQVTVVLTLLSVVSIWSWSTFFFFVCQKVTIIVIVKWQPPLVLFLSSDFHPFGPAPGPSLTLLSYPTPRPLPTKFPLLFQISAEMPPSQEALLDCPEKNQFPHMKYTHRT
jgi:hypothetical protein